MTLTDFRRAYGRDALAFRLCVQRYIEKTAAADPQMAGAILDMLEQLRQALATEPRP